MIGLSWLDVTLDSPEENLRFDEQLLMAGDGVLRVWESERECVVLGRSGRAERDCLPGDIPILRRCSGGGAVLLGPGCLNYSLVLPLAWNPKWRDVRYSLEWVMDRIRLALGVPELRCAGTSDLALYGRKVSGNAQRRMRDAILHHGTLLYDFDAGRAERCLAPPVREPAYRGGRTHRDFLGNLPLTSGEIKARLRRELGEEGGLKSAAS